MVPKCKPATLSRHPAEEVALKRHLSLSGNKNKFSVAIFEVYGKVVVVQSLSPVWLFVTPWTAARQASLSITISQSLLKFISIESVMVFNHFILSHPLFLLPSIFPSISLFQWVGSLHKVAKVLELQLQHQSFQWIFRVDLLLWSPCCPRGSRESSPCLKTSNIQD